jgi:hypothetical protein
MAAVRLAGAKSETTNVRRGRSPVTNGTKSFTIGGNGCSPWTRRWKDLNALHAGDLGGRDYLSESQKSLIRRASTLEVELEAAMSEGADVDIECYGRVASHLRRILESLGLGRVARDVSEEPFSHLGVQAKPYRFYEDEDPADVDRDDDEILEAAGAVSSDCAVPSSPGAAIPEAGADD